MRAMECSLPIGTDEAPEEVARKAADLGVEYVGYWSANFVEPSSGPDFAAEAARAST